jgi:endonuclease/exonuclease/phosphatase family metal-dependent hydrolase
MRLRKRVVLSLAAMTLATASMPPARAASPSQVLHPAVTVMSFNACGGACRHGEVPHTAAHIAAAARQSGAAVVLLQELCYSQYVQVRKLLAVHGYHGRFAAATRSHACGTAFGVAVLVRGGVTESVTLPLPTTGGYEHRTLLGVTTTLAGRRTFVAVVHLSPSPAAGLDRQLTRVVDYLDHHGDDPVIIGGDFNSLPTKPALADLYSRSTAGTGHFIEADELRGGYAHRGGAPTFDTDARKIDYVFFSASAFTAPRATTQPTTLSDHRVYLAKARPRP